MAAKPVFCTLFGTMNAFDGFSVLVIASKSTLPIRPSSSVGQPKNSYRMPAFTVSVRDTCQSSDRNTLKSLNRNRLSVTPNCVSASLPRPRSSCVKLSNFSNSVACSSGRLVSNSLRRNSPPIRSACVSAGPGQRVADRERPLAALVVRVVRAAEREPLHVGAGPSDVVAQTLGRNRVVEERRRVRNADGRVGQAVERIVERPRVAQVEHAARGSR